MKQSASSSSLNKTNEQPHAFAIGRVIVDEFEILNIVVDQNDRGIGLGAMLLSVMRDHAVTWAVTPGYWK